jgi:hypothetical protein
MLVLHSSLRQLLVPRVLAGLHQQVLLLLLLLE